MEGRASFFLFLFFFFFVPSLVGPFLGVSVRV
jgi:hypothetical protein